MYQITFSALMLQLMQASSTALKQLFESLKQNGSSITYTSLSAYKTGTVIPPFEKASEILKVFGYEMSQDDLTSVLSYSRQELKNYKDETGTSHSQGIRILPSIFGEEYSSAQIMSRVDQRVNEGGFGNINNYINHLIKKDLVENNYMEDEEK
jgi:hypothetical protein